MKRSQHDTTLPERIYSWFLGRKVVGPILTVVIVVGTVLIFTGNVAESLAIIRSLLGSGDQAPRIDRESLPESSQPDATGDSTVCRVIVVNAVFDVGPLAAADDEPEDTKVTFDVLQVGPAPMRDTEPFALVVNDYPPGTYKMGIEMGLILKFSGEVKFTEARYYIFRPEVTVYDRFTTSEPIVLTATSRREAALLMARYNKDLPSCENRRVGLSW